MKRQVQAGVRHMATVIKGAELFLLVNTNCCVSHLVTVWWLCRIPHAIQHCSITMRTSSFACMCSHWSIFVIICRGLLLTFILAEILVDGKLALCTFRNWPYHHHVSCSLPQTTPRMYRALLYSNPVRTTGDCSWPYPVVKLKVEQGSLACRAQPLAYMKQHLLEHHGVRRCISCALYTNSAHLHSYEVRIHACYWYKISNPPPLPRQPPHIIHCFVFVMYRRLHFAYTFSQGPVCVHAYLLLVCSGAKWYWSRTREFAWWARSSRECSWSRCSPGSLRLSLSSKMSVSMSHTFVFCHASSWSPFLAKRCLSEHPYAFVLTPEANHMDCDCDF